MELMAEIRPGACFLNQLKQIKQWMSRSNGTDNISLFTWVHALEIQIKNNMRMSLFYTTAGSTITRVPLDVLSTELSMAFSPSNLYCCILQWNLDLTKCQGTGEIGSLYRGFVISRFFSIHLILLGWKILFVIPRTSLCRGSLNRGSTVFLQCSKFVRRKNLR